MAVIKTEGLKEILTKIKNITDPDNDNTQNKYLVELTPGALNRDTGEYITDDNSLVSNYIPIKPGEYTWYCSNKDIVSLVVAYDEDKNRISGWADGVNYAYKANNNIIDFYNGVRYVRFSVGTTDNSIIFGLKMGGIDYFNRTAAELKNYFKKMQLKNNYDITTNEIDEDPTMHGLTIQRTGTNEMFNIVGIAAPQNNPREATLSLTNFGQDITQFVDITSMKYQDDEPGVVGMGIQTRGNTPLPTFDISFNNGGGPKHTFLIEPDAIPVTLTKTGIKTLDENENEVTVDLTNIPILKNITNYIDNHDYLLSNIYENAVIQYGRLVTVTASVRVGIPENDSWHTVFTNLPIPLVPNGIVTFVSRGGQMPIRARINQNGELEAAGGAEGQFYDIVYNYYI